MQKLLGKGGFGETFLAEDTAKNFQLCVVKHLKPQFTEDSLLTLAQRLFKREVEVLDRLGSHDQIPQLLDSFTIGEEFYLVQEFIEGNELSGEINHGWSVQEVIAFLKDILPVLSFVHGYNVIHRDIKPSNLIRRSKDQKVVLIDFGAVKEITTLVITTGGQTSLTVAIGTPGYMPSEQQSGKPKYCSDLYALGMLCIEGLTRVSASDFYDDPATGELVWHHHLKQQNIPPLLKAILDRMIRYDFRERYQSANAILEALSALEQPRIHSAPTVPSPGLRSWQGSPTTRKHNTQSGEPTLVWWGLGLTGVSMLFLFTIGLRLQPPSPSVTNSPVATLPASAPIEPSPPRLSPRATPSPKPNPVPIPAQPSPIVPPRLLPQGSP